jgi:hypothetical protein
VIDSPPLKNKKLQNSPSIKKKQSGTMQLNRVNYSEYSSIF